MTVIKIENISKYYRLGLIGGGTLREDVNRWIAKLSGKPDPLLKVDQQDHGNRKDGQIWALRDVNLEVKEGEILGIIGRNGAGKSTLLKILSKITAPTEGKIKIKGRVGSLLEVGTGFHPELTGRENIFLNGAILGMSRPEIKSKLHEIIEFAEVAKFIDTPVKRYSSGMTVRLAFAVAAHLEPEILVVDEVLAVGDAAFQKKCIGKMEDVSMQGRTVLFVSHNMQTISSITKSCVILSNGRVEYKGNTGEAIAHYLENNKTTTYNYCSEPNANTPKITHIDLITSKPGNIQDVESPMRIVFKISTPINIKGAALSFQICDSFGSPIIHSLILDQELAFCREPGFFKITCTIPRLRLYIGHYKVKVHFADGVTKRKFQTIDETCNFEVVAYSRIRDFYWRPNTAKYIEDVNWNVEKQ